MSLDKKERKKRIAELREFLLENTPVVQHASGRGYIKKNSAKQVFVKGLTKILARTFYADYEYIANKYQASGSSGLSNPGDGLRRGRQVHDQLQSFGNRTSLAKFKRENPILNEYTHNAIAWMIKYNLEPVFAEFPVADETVALGTAIDMLCVDEDFNLVIIEWKNGFNNYVHRGSDQMQGPFKTPLTNSPLNQAFLQLCFTTLFFEISTGVTNHKSYVVNINEEGVAHYELPKEIWKQRTDLYLHALQNMVMYKSNGPEKKKKKKKAKQNRNKRVASQKKRISKKTRKSSLF